MYIIFDYSEMTGKCLANTGCCLIYEKVILLSISTSNIFWNKSSKIGVQVYIFFFLVIPTALLYLNILPCSDNDSYLVLSVQLGWVSNYIRCTKWKLTIQHVEEHNTKSPHVNFKAVECKLLLKSTFVYLRTHIAFGS